MMQLRGHWLVGTELGLKVLQYLAHQISLSLVDRLDDVAHILGEEEARPRLGIRRHREQAGLLIEGVPRCPHIHLRSARLVCVERDAGGGGAEAASRLNGNMPASQPTPVKFCRYCWLLSPAVSRMCPTGGGEGQGWRRRQEKPSGKKICLTTMDESRDDECRQRQSVRRNVGVRAYGRPLEHTR